MQISITTRHFREDEQIKDEQIKEYLIEKLKKLEKFSARLVSARAILIRENYRHIAEVTLTGKNLKFAAKEISEDMHSAVDLAAAKLQKQLLRFRDRVKEHKARRFAKKNWIKGGLA